MAFLSRGTVNIILCLGLAFVAAFVAAFNVHAADDDYLKMLEAEAEGSHIDDSGQAKRHAATATSAPAVAETKKWVGECDYISDAMPTGLQWEEFASYIKQCSLGTYVFYRRLDPNSQSTVYKSYTAMSPTNLSVLKEEVLKYY